MLHISTLLMVAHPPIYLRIAIHTFLRPAYPQGGGRKSYATGSRARMEIINSDSALLVFVYSRNLKSFININLHYSFMLPVIGFFEVFLVIVYFHQIHTFFVPLRIIHELIYHITQSSIADSSTDYLSELYNTCVML